MNIRGKWRALGRNDTVRFSLFVTGCVLIMLAPLASPLPGPGGLILFGAGASLALKNSAWAKRRYARFKRRWPKPGAWADWGLRRESARRRHAISKARAADSD